MNGLQRAITVLAVLAMLVVTAYGVTVVTRSDVAAVPAAQQQGEFYREFADAANVITADEQTAAFNGFAAADLAAFFLTCTEDSGTATLDVAIQRSLNGTAWANLTTFTQLAATGSQTVLYADVRAASAQMIGNRLRVNYDVTGSGQYTCSLFGAAEG